MAVVATSWQGRVAMGKGRVYPDQVFRDTDSDRGREIVRLTD
ncbi:MAG TPA: hypothetical protein VFU78_09100 [Thermomicrobiales bacterium]|jgi:hypothetical protein|nr:hypothetical protein [Thermomicrobiales bacterium]